MDNLWIWLVVDLPLRKISMGYLWNIIVNIYGEYLWWISWWISMIWWLVGGWLNPSEKYEFVNWDDDIPNISGKMSQSCSSHHQLVIARFYYQKYLCSIWLCVHKRKDDIGTSFSRLIRVYIYIYMRCILQWHYQGWICVYLQSDWMRLDTVTGCNWLFHFKTKSGSVRLYDCLHLSHTCYWYFISSRMVVSTHPHDIIC